MIELHSCCFYPSYDGYRNSDYPPNRFIKCLKGEPFRGYADIPYPGGGTRRISAANGAPALLVFAKWAASQLASMAVPNACLVPIPSSTHTNPAADFTGLRLCRAINAVAGNAYPIMPLITQKSAVLGSSKGGSRKFTEIRDNLVCHASPAGRTVILVDDVATSGNHIKACATILRQAGGKVDHAVVAGRTAWERKPDMWAVPFENIDWANDDFTFGIEVSR